MVTRTQLARLGLFDAKVPRYTSYPTAPHFGGGVGESQVDQWIRAIPEGARISLYVHVPFCRRLCWFCACRTQGTKTGAPVAGYVETLKAELAALKTRLPRGVRLSRLHWGGGTPTLLSPDQIRDLADSIRDVADFAEGAEFSIEIDPNEVDAERVTALAASGMTRASIGVQDFDVEIQKAIGRIQGYDLTRRTIDMLRDAGIQSLNADILYGLPHQTRARVTTSVQKLLSFAPDRVALYGYAHVPWMAKRQQMIPSDALPTPQERLDLFETARKLFLWDGYDEVGIDHFALPQDGLAVAQRAGTLRRNFQGYTDDTADVLIGVGASSISRFPQGFAQNDPRTSGYAQAVANGALPIVRGHVFAGQDRLRARMIEALMCDFRISTTEIHETFGIPVPELATWFARINRQFEGLLNVTEDGVFVPGPVRPLLRMIARELDAYDLSKAGHSSAI